MRHQSMMFVNAVIFLFTLVELSSGRAVVNLHINIIADDTTLNLSIDYPGQSPQLTGSVENPGTSDTNAHASKHTEGSILSGRDVARSIYARLRGQINTRRQDDQSFRPIVAFVMVGDNESGRRHRRLSMKAMADNELEMTLMPVELNRSTSEGDLIREIQALNDDPAVNAILLVQPLMSEHNISLRSAIEAIAPSKDVEGAQYANYEMLGKGLDGTVPPTPAASLAFIHQTNVTLQGKHIVVITKQSIEMAMEHGNPTVQLMRREGCFVTFVDPDVKNASIVCRQADIVIAMARPGQTQINRNWIKKDALVIDAGFDLTPDGKPTGYVNTTDVLAFAKWVTPVPGGIGPVHVAYVLVNTVQCALKQRAV